MYMGPRRCELMKPMNVEVHSDAHDDGPLYISAAKVVPWKVHGTFRRTKWALLVFCLAAYCLLPFARWDRGPNEPHQAVLVDLAHSRTYFFFIELWPREVYYFTGLLIPAALSLFLSNALFDRVWCGYFCWPTIWTAMFIAVERWIEGDRRNRTKLEAAPWSASKLRKRPQTRPVGDHRLGRRRRLRALFHRRAHTVEQASDGTSAACFLFLDRRFHVHDL